MNQNVNRILTALVPEAEQKIGLRTNPKILYDAKHFFQYEIQKFKNRKPDRKPDPEEPDNHVGKWTSTST